MPTDYGHTDKTLRLISTTDTHTNRRKDGCYQVHFLPGFAVDKKYPNCANKKFGSTIFYVYFKRPTGWLNKIASSWIRHSVSRTVQGINRPLPSEKSVPKNYYSGTLDLQQNPFDGYCSIHHTEPILNADQDFIKQFRTQSDYIFWNSGLYSLFSLE